MDKYIVVDWANNPMFKGKVFLSEEEAMDFMFDALDDEIDNCLVVPINEYKATPLSVLDALESKTFRSQL